MPTLSEQIRRIRDTRRTRIIGSLLWSELTAASGRAAELETENARLRDRAEEAERRADLAEAQLRMLTGTIPCHEDANGEWVPSPVDLAQQTEQGGADQ